VRQRAVWRLEDGRGVLVGYRIFAGPDGKEILLTCSGIVVVLPRKSYPQTTTPYIFLEMLLAVRHRLPILLLCEQGIKLKLERGTGELVLIFGSPGDDSGAIVTADQVSKPSFQVSQLQRVHTVICPVSPLLGEPIFLPHVPRDSVELSSIISSRVEEFVGSFRQPERNAYVFLIMPYAKEWERLVVANAVYQETGLACHNASDAWGGAPFTREEIIQQIRDAWLVMADLSGLSRACVFETGVAIGSGRATFVITKTPHQSSHSASATKYRR
jgi:hypothetical protein